MVIGDRVRDFVTRREATVIGVQDDAVRLEWDDAQGQETFWYSVDYFTASGAVHPHIEVIPSEPVTAPATTDVWPDRTDYYVNAVGMMEYRLYATYDSISRAVQRLSENNIAGAQWHLAWALDTIQETAERLADKPTSKAATPLTWLRDMIYRNRK